MRAVISVCLFALTGCATQQYWVKSSAGYRQTAADLQACRLQGSKESTQQVFTAQQIENPCMVAKGYELSDKPTTTP